MPKWRIFLRLLFVVVLLHEEMNVNVLKGEFEIIKALVVFLVSGKRHVFFSV